MTALLEIAALTVASRGTTLVEDVSLRIPRQGGALALVGESGSGKSTIARAIMRLQHGVTIAGRIALEGEDLVTASERRMRAIRGGRIGMIFQEPMTSLDPCFRVGTQLAEAMRLHGVRASRGALAAALAEAGLDDSGVARRYPHALSGGQRQRAMIAIALAASPALLIADEPTTALDATVQKRILDLLGRARAERGMGLLLITHDVAIAAGHADAIAVLYAGRIIELGPARAVTGAPRHPYTASLLASRPLLSAPRARLAAIPGAVPSPGALPSGCAFRTRCDRATSRCSERPALEGGIHRVACWHARA